MKILKPNIGKEFVLIVKQHIYTYATDTKQILFLKEIKIAVGQHTWEWISLRSDRCIDISGINDRYCSFDNAINKAVNNLYCTVYEFKNMDEVFTDWNRIKYIDSIETVYKSEES